MVIAETDFRTEVMGYHIEQDDDGTFLLTPVEQQTYRHIYHPDQTPKLVAAMCAGHQNELYSRLVKFQVVGDSKRDNLLTYRVAGYKDPKIADDHGDLTYDDLVKQGELIEFSVHPDGKIVPYYRQMETEFERGFFEGLGHENDRRKEARAIIHGVIAEIPEGKVVTIPLLGEILETVLGTDSVKLVKDIVYETYWDEKTERYYYTVPNLHRVVGPDGGIANSIWVSSEFVSKKLEQEGVRFNESRVILREHLWLAELMESNLSTHNANDHSELEKNRIINSKYALLKLADQILQRFSLKRKASKDSEIIEIFKVNNILFEQTLGQLFRNRQPFTVEAWNEIASQIQQ